MKKEIKGYLKYMDDVTASDTGNWDVIAKSHLDRICFYQHERLVHLITLVLVAILTLLTVLQIFQTKDFSLLVLFLLFLVLLIPYIFYYYFLENAVQKMYRQYYLIEEKIKAMKLMQ